MTAPPKTPHPLLFAPAASQGSVPDTEIGRLFHEMDWSATPLGPVEVWPQSLRIAVSIALNSRFPMFVWWGSELVNIYNDAYIPVLGKRHPQAFGGRAREIWNEIWPVLGPQVDEVMQHGRATWNERVLLVMERNDFTEETYFTWSYSPVYDDQGGIGGLFCACSEETPRVRVERERDALLQRAQGTVTTLQGWFDNAPGFVAVLRGPDFVFEMVNRAYYQLVGHRPIEGRPAFEALPEVRSQGFIEILERVYREGEPFIGRGLRLILQKEPGGPLSEAFVDLVYQPVFDVHGRVSGIFAQGHDVTEQVRAVEALKEGDRRKDEFLATLAHELRNPLAPIRQSAKLVKTPGLTAAQHHWAIDVIDRQATHMALLLDDLLDVARISRGRLELRMEPVALSSVVASAVETAQPLIEAKRHRLSVTLPAEPVVLTADPLRLAQVLSNLLSNAAKYMDDGGAIEVQAQARPGAVAIRVRDNGIGVAQESLQTLFQMFSQVSSALQRAEGGLGIGLALSKGLVEMHGGSIEAHSDGLGRGAEFVVHLPWMQTESLEGGQPEAPQGQAALRRKVLIADDNHDASTTLAALLELDGHEVHTASTGNEALALAEQLRPDIAILDIGMPGRNGYQVASEIRRADWGRGMTLIALTGWGQAEDRRQAVAAGFDEHWTKPVDTDTLQALFATPGRAGSSQAGPAR
ncbi:ATP-binding protein [Aquabacterium sp. A7-Y]|uniref:hybrid sensor histidine kinase/response regulator n=1 Tax=Aquabacterium sp. A7-Y TaxID=1349605 RepID=UPI00223DDB83|nr:ATP-binding protein [Aquabacterium sp. A7-Y]MCW7538064.1 ATP-binding protein [Aquabacterium sp. A7-Y]